MTSTDVGTVGQSMAVGSAGHLTVKSGWAVCDPQPEVICLPHGPFFVIKAFDGLTGLTRLRQTVPGATQSAPHTLARCGHAP